MAPSNVDYQENGMENHKKFETFNYTHKKFGKKSNKDVASTPLFRPYALSENTPRKRRQNLQQREQQTHVPQHQLPPTPPTTPPQQQQHLYKPHPDQQQQQQPHQHHQQSYLGTPINHQAYAFMLQKQRAVLQMRQLLSINPDANTWPLEWRQALQSLLQQ